MRSGSRLPNDFSLVFHDSLSDSYELSSVLLATADFDGTLQLLTSGWERLLGYGRQELRGKTLLDLLWSDHRGAADAVAAILERVRMSPVGSGCAAGTARGSASGCTAVTTSTSR